MEIKPLFVWSDEFSLMDNLPLNISRSELEDGVKDPGYMELYEGRSLGIYEASPVS